MMASNSRPMLTLLPTAAEGPLTARADDELMLLARGGMQTAFEVLVRRHQARMLRIAMRYTGDATLAQDVAQSAFLELFRSCDRYQSRDRFVGYLCRIVINQCRMATRAARTRRQHVMQASADVSQDADAILQRERRRDLQRAVDRLSEKLRLVVVLRYGGELELTEIADTLELPLGTVKRRLFDAMAKLRDFLECEP